MSERLMPTRPSRLRFLDPELARVLAIVLYLFGAWVAWVMLWPESWEQFKATLEFVRPLIGPVVVILLCSFIPMLALEVLLLDRFGKLGPDGKVRYHSDPKGERLDKIEAAINRLHDYVQAIDPDLDEERRLQRELFGGRAMFVGMDLNDYTRERQATGKRTLATSIWRDLPEPDDAEAGRPAASQAK